MKKKILAIFLVVMFVMMSLTTLSCMGIKKNATEKSGIVGMLDVTISRFEDVAYAGVWLVSPGLWGGTYEASLYIQFSSPGPGYKIYALIENAQVSLYRQYSGPSYDILYVDRLEYEYCNYTTPEPIKIVQTKNVQNNFYNHYGKVCLYVCVWKWNDASNGWYIHDQFTKEAKQYNSCNRNQAINTPFFNFLQHHPILLQLIQRFLKL